MAEILEKHGFSKPQLIKSKGGVFEIRKDGVLLFSKLKERRFPETQEVLDLIANAN